MVSYVVTGANRGIGLAFVQALQARLALRPPSRLQKRDSQDAVFAIVQDLDSCGELRKLADSNVHILQGDLDKPETLHSAATSVAEVTGGSVDVLINNAALLPLERGGYTLTSYIGKDDLLIRDFNTFYKTNVVGTAIVTNAFLPLIEKGAHKKVINISSAACDPQFVEKTGYTAAVAYGISKAALNHISTKYAVEFRGKGYTFLAISPGLVDTRPDSHTPANKAARDSLIKMFKTGYPHWSGIPLRPRESAELMLGVIDRATPKDSGGFVSQYGDQRWL